MATKTRKNTPKKHILFMFLGGLPSEEHILEHYKLFFSKSKDTRSLRIVVHPMNLDTYELNKSFHTHIAVVDKDHWIKTQWGTRSLTDATLLMMQFAFLHFGDIFKKYILLSSTCAPLYNYTLR